MVPGVWKKMGVLEKGMVSGNTSVAVLVEIEGGKCVFAEVSAANFINAAAILAGFLMRTGEIK